MPKEVFKIIFLCLLCSACSNFPKDPEGTLEKVKGKTLKVGVAESPPFAIINNGKVSGREAELIQDYARTINARVEWVPGSQEGLMMLMKEHQVDVAIGGYTNDEIWKKKAGISQPYYIEKISIGIPEDMPEPDGLKDREVYVKNGSPALAIAAKENMKAVRYDSIPPRKGLTLAPEEELRQLGLKVTDKKLKEIKHVIAVPKGENALLRSIEKYIYEHVRKEEG